MDWQIYRTCAAFEAFFHFTSLILMTTSREKRLRAAHTKWTLTAVVMPVHFILTLSSWLPSACSDLWILKLLLRWPVTLISKYNKQIITTFIHSCIYINQQEETLLCESGIANHFWFHTLLCWNFFHRLWSQWRNLSSLTTFTVDIKELNPFELYKHVFSHFKEKRVMTVV